MVRSASLAGMLPAQESWPIQKSLTFWEIYLFSTQPSVRQDLYSFHLMVQRTERGEAHKNKKYPPKKKKKSGPTVMNVKMIVYGFG